MKQRTGKSSRAVISIGMMIFALFVVLMCPQSIRAETATVLTEDARAQTDEISDKKVLRVGYPIQYGMTEKTGGKYSGYTYEYLQEMAQYTGWEYEFVELEGTSNEVLTKMLDMLEKGELDLLGGILMNKYTTDKFDFAGRNYGMAYSTLLVLEENTKINETTCQTVGKLRVAVLATSKLYVENLKKFCETNKIEYELVPCASEEEQAQLLHEDKADALLTVDLSQFDDMRSIAKFAPSPFYFVTTKGNTDIVSGLNFSIQKINDSDPYFNTGLYEKYFGRSTANLVLTDEEKKVVDQHHTIKLGVVADKAPFQYKLNEDSEITGVSVSVLNSISEKTGLEFELVEFQTSSELQLSAKNHEIDGILGMKYEYSDSMDYDVSLTRAYVSAQVVMIANKSVDVANFSEKKRAIQRDISYSEDVYNPKFIYFDNLVDCMDAVNSGKADYTYANAYAVEYYARRPEYKNVLLIPQANSEQKICIGLVKPTNVNILTTINKAICSIDDTEIQSLIFQNTAVSGVEISFFNWLDSNPRQVVLAVAILALVIMITVVIFARSRINTSRDMALNNKRYVTLAEMSNELLFEYDYQKDELKLSEKCANAFDAPKEIKDYLKNRKPQNSEESSSIGELGYVFATDVYHESIVDEVFYKLGNGEKHWFRVTCMPILEDGTTLRYTVGKLVDIQEEVERRGRLIEKSQKDGLTNIYNPATSKEIISEYISKRCENSIDAMLVIDVDQFKNVNDNLGHYTGDLVLKDIAKTLVDLSKSGDVVGRLGGDEFIICLKSVENREAVSRKCKELCDAVRRTIKSNNKTHNLSISIGAAVIRPGADFNEVFERADKALYTVKQNGRDSYEIAEDNLSV